MKKITWCKLTAFVLMLSLIFTMLAGCGETPATQEESDILYGDAVDDEDDDDEDVVDSDVVSGTTSTITKKKSAGSKAVEYDSKYKTSVSKKIDAKKASSYIESVPKSLSGTTVKILSWWGMLDNEKAKFEEFEKKTGIKVKFIQTGTDQYYTKLSSLKAAGNSPDLACILNDVYPSAILMNYFRPLSESKLDISKKNVYDIDSMNKFKWNNKYYGALVKGSTLIDFSILFYNQDMFTQNGVKSPYDYYNAKNWNWDTFLKCCHEIQNKTGKPALSAEAQGCEMVQSCGEDSVIMNNGQMKNNIGSKTFRNAWKWVDSLTETEKVADWSLNRQGFMKGKCAMEVEVSWALQKGERYDDVSFAYGFVPLPSPKGKATSIPSAAKLWGFPVGCENIEAASYLFEYWQDPTYNVKGQEMWINDSAANFIDWLWEQPKTFEVTKGIVEYGGDYAYVDMVSELSSLGGGANVDSNADKWSKVITANIKKILSDWK